MTILLGAAILLAGAIAIAAVVLGLAWLITRPRGHC